MNPILPPVLRQIEALLRRSPRAIVAIDGRSASGKTTLAALLGETFSCNVIHMDDYYLPLARRPAHWQELPAGNMDLSRLQQEVLVPARTGQAIWSRPYNCQLDRLSPAPSLFSPAPLTILEGSYSLHPTLRGFYDLSIFLTCSKSVQEARLRVRAPEKVTAFQTLWVPLEERYFALCGVESAADLVVNTDSEEARS